MSKKRKIIDDESSIDSLESESELDLASDGADSGLDDSDEDDKISLKKSNMPTTPAMAVPRNEKTPIKTAQPSVSISSTTKTMTTHTKKVAAALPESSTSCAVNLASSSTPNAIDTLHSSMNIDITKGGPVTTEASAKKLLLEYFKKQNRPYSSIQVYDNLHHRIQKPVVERLLATLSSLSSNPLENDILCKEYGKAKIYYYNQAKLAEFSSFTDKQIAELDKELKSISAKVDEQRAKYKAIKAAVETLQREPTDAELDVQLKDLEATVKDKRAKLGSISNQTVDKNALNKLILRHNKRRSLCMSRKTKCMDVVDSISDSMGKSIKSVMLEFGIETDEEAAEKIPAAIPLPK